MCSTCPHSLNSIVMLVVTTCKSLCEEMQIQEDITQDKNIMLDIGFDLIDSIISKE